MGLGATFLLYLLLGGGVAFAVALRAGSALTTVIPAVLFWPLYVPGLLSEPAPDLAHPAPPTAAESPADDLETAIARVEQELDQALRSLDGWAESALSSERIRLDELRATWRSQAARIRELDRLLEDAASAGSTFPPVEPADPALETASPRITQSERTRRENLTRLERIRDQLHDDLLATLTWVRELVTMIHLAKFTGAPASRAEELVSQIAAAVEGLTTVSAWDDEQMAVAADVGVAG